MDDGRLLPIRCPGITWDKKKNIPVKCNKLCVKVFPGSSGECQCLTEKSRLTTSKGDKSIADVHVGEKVKAFNENTLKPEWATVLARKAFVPKRLFKVELENGDYFCATADHKVYTNDGWRRIDEILEKPTEYNILEVC